eukprot:scaffold374765_cov18-Prasinocladus_malaysianus.AAC.1
MIIKRAIQQGRHYNERAYLIRCRRGHRRHSSWLSPAGINLPAARFICHQLNKRTLGGCGLAPIILLAANI